MNPESILESLSDGSVAWSRGGKLAESVEADKSEKDAPPADSVVVVAVGSIRYDTPPLSPLKTITDRSKRNSFNVEERDRLAEARTLGFRPLSSTFLRALMPTQFTSCFIASLSETARRGAVRRSVPVLGRVWKGVMVLGRTGVAKG